MLIAFNSFSTGSFAEEIEAQLIGKPVYPNGTIIRFIRYGTYVIGGVENPDSLVPTYSLFVLERYPGSPSTVPAGTVAYLQEEDLTVGSLPYTATRFLDLRGPDYQLIPLEGNITFAAQQHFPGRAVTVRVKNTSGVSSRTLSFPSSWIFLGSKPSSIGPSKTAVLSVTCLGTSDADVIAAWAVQSD